QADATPYLGRTFTGRIAPACGWRTYSITSCRYLPIPDSCTAARRIPIRSPRWRSRATCRRFGGRAPWRCGKISSFDELVGECVQADRHVQAQSPGRSHVDDELEARRLLHRNLRRCHTLKDFIDLMGSAPETVREIGAIGHQAARFGKLAKAVD